MLIVTLAFGLPLSFQEPLPLTPPSPLVRRSERAARGQELLAGLRRTVPMAPHGTRVQLDVVSQTLVHGAVPGALRERKLGRSLTLFADGPELEIDGSTWDSAMPAPKVRTARYAGVDARRESELGPRANLGDILRSHAVLPGALLQLVATKGSVRDHSLAAGEAQIQLDLAGAQVSLRFAMGTDGLGGALLGVDWLVHDEVLGDTLERLTYLDEKGAAPGVAAGFTVAGPMGEMHAVKVAASGRMSSDLERAEAPEQSSPRSALEAGDVAVTVRALGEDLFEVLLPKFDARVLALALDEGWAVMEAPVASGVGEAICSALEEKRPGLGFAYALASHHHPHYVGALRPLVARGAAVVCAEGVKGYVKSLLERPRTLFPDRLARSGRRGAELVVIGVKSGERWSPAGESGRLIALEAAGRSQHTDAFLVFFAPEHRLGFGGDLLWLAAQGRTPRCSPRTKGLAAILETSGIDTGDYLTSWPVVPDSSEDAKWKSRATLAEISALAAR